MATVINPIFQRYSLFESTKYRFNNLTTPIQATNEKESDILAYIATPIIDSYILADIYTIDACIHLLNTVASLGKAAHIWVMNQQKSSQIIDGDTSIELQVACSHFSRCISAIIAQTFNTILSILALITRPIASIVHAINGANATQPTDTHRAPPPAYAYR